MSELATPTAQRLRRPSWRDTRLLVGVFLVLASTAMGGLLMARADDTVPVYAAQRALVPGQALVPGDVRVVDVRLGEGAAPYLRAESDLTEGLHALRPIGAGELIAQAAVGGMDSVRTRLLAVQVDGAAVSTLQSGSLVDVYVNRPSGATGPAGGTAFQGPERVLEGASVAAIPEQDGVLGGVAAQRPVQLVVPVDTVKEIVEAVDQGARLTLVPVPGGKPSGAS